MNKRNKLTTLSAEIVAVLTDGIPRKWSTGRRSRAVLARAESPALYPLMISYEDEAIATACAETEAEGGYWNPLNNCNTALTAAVNVRQAALEAVGIPRRVARSRAIRSVCPL